jgi:cysteine desulfurase
VSRIRTRLYLDHLTTTPLDPRVRSAMMPYLGEEFGSPTAQHARGRRLERALEEARAEVAALIRAPSEEIRFGGSATECNNLAIKGTILAAASSGRILAAATEHISVVHPLLASARRGADVVFLPVDEHGLVDPDLLRREARRGAALVSIAHASAEIGTLQPIADLVRVCSEAGVPFHCDATATAGLVPLPEEANLPDLVTFTPHLFGGPQGIAALRVREGHRLQPLVEGGTQEGGLRAGTLPMAAVAGFAAAAALARSERAERAGRATALAIDLRTRLQRLEGARLTGHPERRLPGHLSLCLRGVDGEALLRALDESGIEASSGSPCATGAGKPSRVLEALGIPPALARGALTFMFGPGNGPDDPERAAAALGEAAERLRRLSPLETGG